jgi:hypothetical protein
MNFTTLIIKLFLGVLVLFLPMLIFAVIVGFYYIQFSFLDSIKWIMGKNNPFVFPFSLFYYFWTIFTCVFTIKRIKSNE